MKTFFKFIVTLAFSLLVGFGALMLFSYFRYDGAGIIAFIIVPGIVMYFVHKSWIKPGAVESINKFKAETAAQKDLAMKVAAIQKAQIEEQYNKIK